MASQYLPGKSRRLIRIALVILIDQKCDIHSYTHIQETSIRASINLNLKSKLEHNLIVFQIKTPY